MLLLLTLLSAPLLAQDLNESNWGKNTPGFELATHEGQRQPSPQGGTTLLYNLVGKGFPTGVPYKLWGWAPGKEPRLLIDGASFDKRGLLVCASGAGFCPGAGKDDPVNIKAAATLGEPLRFGVVSADGKTMAFTEAVPFPIQASDKVCKVSVVRQSTLADVVEVRASGFTPYEMMTVTVPTNGSTQGPTATAQGTWQGTLHVDVRGETAGTAMVKISGHDCTVQVSFKWGQGNDQRQ
jgi:hypothetical protein